jgi:hypothetical protein
MLETGGLLRLNVSNAFLDTTRAIFQLCPRTLRWLSVSRCFRQHGKRKPSRTVASWDHQFLPKHNANHPLVHHSWSTALGPLSHNEVSWLG